MKIRTNKNRISILESKYRPVEKKCPEIKILVNSIDYYIPLSEQINQINNTDVDAATKETVIKVLEEFEELY